MKRRPKNIRSTIRQETPEELLGYCVSLLQRKYYEGKEDQFYQDRQRLLDWVVLWPAKWLNDRGVSVTTDRYREIFTKVFMDGLVFGDTDNIAYLPAWLAKVIQSHFGHHGDEIYEEAKSVRTLVENALLVAGRQQGPTGPDPIRQLASAHRLVSKANRKRPARPSAIQPDLFQ